jgi:hypothetical protein
MAILAALMISDVPYPAIPQIGFRSVRQLLGSVVVGGSIILLVVRREEFIFPALLAYVLFGAVKWVIIGFLGRAGTPDEIFWENEPNGAEPRDERRASHGRAIPLDADDSTVVSLQDARRADEGSQQPPSARRRKRRRGHRGATRPHGSNPNAPHPSAESSSSDTSKGPTE